MTKVTKKAKLSGVKKQQERAAEIMAKMEAMKPLYNEFDEIVQFLQASGCDKFSVDGVDYVIIDNFVSKNTAFKAVGFKRFDIKKV